MFSSKNVYKGQFMVNDRILTYVTTYIEVSQIHIYERPILYIHRKSCTYSQCYHEFIRILISVRTTVVNRLYLLAAIREVHLTSHLVTNFDSTTCQWKILRSRLNSESTLFRRHDFDPHLLTTPMYRCVWYLLCLPKAISFARFGIFTT